MYGVMHTCHTCTMRMPLCIMNLTIMPPRYIYKAAHVGSSSIAGLRINPNPVEKQPEMGPIGRAFEIIAKVFLTKLNIFVLVEVGLQMKPTFTAKIYVFFCKECFHFGGLMRVLRKSS